MISLKSEITQKLLNYFFLNPEESLYVNELARKLKVDKRNLMKKVKELEAEGLLKSSEKGNLKLYSINQDYSLYEEFRKIVLKTLGLEESLRKLMSEFKGVKKVFLYGSYATDKMDTHSDIDLLVVGNHDSIKLQRKLSALQKEIDRIINAVNMSPADYQKRIKKKDPFLIEVLKNKHIVIK